MSKSIRSIPIPIKIPDDAVIAIYNNTTGLALVVTNPKGRELVQLNLNLSTTDDLINKLRTCASFVRKNLLMPGRGE